MSAEPTPKIALADWNLSIIYENEVLCKINWDTLKNLPSREFTKDIHCVTRWTKFDMKWKGVKISTLFNELSDFWSPNIFQLAIKYIYLFVIIKNLIYRFVFYRSIT